METGREGIGLQRSSRMWRTRGSDEQVLRLVQRTWTCGRARGAEQGRLLWKVHYLPRGFYLCTTAFKVESNSCSVLMITALCTESPWTHRDESVRQHSLTFAIFLTLKNVM